MIIKSQMFVHFVDMLCILKSQTPEKHVCPYLQNSLHIDRMMQVLIKLIKGSFSTYKLILFILSNLFFVFLVLVNLLNPWKVISTKADNLIDLWNVCYLLKRLKAGIPSQKRLCLLRIIFCPLCLSISWCSYYLY